MRCRFESPQRVYRWMASAGRAHTATMTTSARLRSTGATWSLRLPIAFSIRPANTCRMPAFVMLAVQTRRGRRAGRWRDLDVHWGCVPAMRWA